MPTQLKRYAFINAKLRTRLSKILTREFLLRIGSAQTLSEACQMLEKTDFEPVSGEYARTGDLKSAELLLFKKEIILYQEIAKYADPVLKDFIIALLLRYEIENLKAGIRLFFDRRIRGRNITVSSGYLFREVIINFINIDTVINADSFSDLLSALENTPYAELIAEYEKTIIEDKSLFPAEMTLDLFFYRNLQSVAEKLPQKDREIIKRMLGVEIDIENILRIMRFKLFYNISLEQALAYSIDGGYKIGREMISSAYKKSSAAETLSGILADSYPGFGAVTQGETDTYRRMAFLQSVLNEILEKEISRTLTRSPFTIGIVLSYFILKKQEIRRIISVLNAKFYRLSGERIGSIL